MTLPPLPRQNKKKEADFGEYLATWLKKNPRFSCAIETKQTQTNSFPFSEVKDEQIAWGLQISSDKGALVRVFGLTGQPDYIWCRNMPSYVIIRYPRSFHVISIGTFVEEKKNSLRKSLTAERAGAISIISVKLSTSAA